MYHQNELLLQSEGQFEYFLLLFSWTELQLEMMGWKVFQYALSVHNSQTNEFDI